MIQHTMAQHTMVSLCTTACFICLQVVRRLLWHYYYFVACIYTQASLQLKSKMSSLPSDYKTRGNSRKLEVRRCRYDLRKYSFSNRITNMWNSLPDSVVLADTVNQFKNRLDKHWANYAFLYDYLVNYNGTGSLFVV